MDEHALQSHMIFELSGDLGTKLSGLSGRIPQALGENVLAYGFSFDIAAAKKLALEFVTEIETDPYKCELFTSMNQQASTFKAQLNTPLPPFVSNFKGFNLVIDELDLDLTKTEPQEMIKSLKANLLLAVDNPEAILGMAQMAMPEIQKLGIKKGASAVNVSSLIPVKGSAMPINLDHVFLALSDETIGVSLGEGTDSLLTKAVAGDSTNDLLSFNIKADLYKKIFSGIEKVTSSLSPEVKKQFEMQKLMMNDMLWWDSESGTLDFTDDGFEIDIDIKY